MAGPVTYLSYRKIALASPPSREANGEQNAPANDAKRLTTVAIKRQIMHNPS